MGKANERTATGQFARKGAGSSPGLKGLFDTKTLSATTAAMARGTFGSEQPKASIKKGGARGKARPTAQTPRITRGGANAPASPAAGSLGAAPASGTFDRAAMVAKLRKR